MGLVLHRGAPSVHVALTWKAELVPNLPFLSAFEPGRGHFRDPSYPLAMKPQVCAITRLDFRMRSVATAAALLALICMPRVVRGDCMPATLQAFLVTPLADAIPNDRSLLVGLRQNYDTGVRTPGPDFPTLSLRRGSRVIPLRVEPLAPMLARYVPASPPPAGEYELVGLGAQVRFGAPSTTPPLRAPRVRAVQRRAQAESYGSSSLAMRVVLAAAPPAGAVALIVRGHGGVFGQAALTGALEYTILSDGDCEQRPQARVEPPAVGGRVEVCFVSATGEIGPPRTLRVTQG